MVQIPKRQDNWQKTLITHVKISIDPAVVKIIAPVFSHKDLGKEELSKKCLHSTTQNVNESLNNVIWVRFPKRIYVGRNVFKMSMSAVIAYNDCAQRLYCLCLENLELMTQFTRIG